MRGSLISSSILRRWIRCCRKWKSKTWWAVRSWTQRGRHTRISKEKRRSTFNPKNNRVLVWRIMRILTRNSWQMRRQNVFSLNSKWTWKRKASSSKLERLKSKTNFDMHLFVYWSNIINLPFYNEYIWQNLIHHFLHMENCQIWWENFLGELICDF